MGVFTVGRQVALEILMPGWWLSGSSIDLDFRNGRYYDSSVPDTVSVVTSYLSCTRASVGYAKDSSGTWISFASNQLRITDLGLLCEDARTNNLLNSAAPATQTTASLATGSYTLWVEGSGSALASGGSATITGAASASQDNPDTFTVTVAGTVTVTVTGSLTRFQLEAGSFASSFIPTTGAAATRAADAVLCSGNLNTILSALPHSDVIDISSLVPVTSLTSILADDTHGPADLQTQNNNTSIVSYLNAVGLSASFPTGTYSSGVKVGLGVTTGARSVVGDGGTVNTDTNATTGTSGFIYLGSGAASFRVWYGYIRRATFWNSKLADATLQALTAP